MAKSPHTGGAMRGFYPVSQVVELAAGWRDTTLETGDVQPWQCASLSYGRGMDHLSAEEMRPLLDELMAHGTEGLWTALEIVTMVLYGGERSPKPFFATIRSILVAPALFDKVVRGTSDGFHVQEMIALLVKNDAIDKKFARTLVKQLFSICKQHDSDIHFIMDSAVRTALQTLLEGYPKEIWAEASRLLLQDDPVLRCRLEHLVESLFYNLPAELYLDWARKAPAQRACIILKWIPLTINTTGEGLAWHPALETFKTEFGAANHVLDELSTRLFPSSWLASLV